jgi:hypothetical protein
MGKGIRRTSLGGHHVKKRVMSALMMFVPCRIDHHRRLFTRIAWSCLPLHLIFLGKEQNRLVWKSKSRHISDSTQLVVKNHEDYLACRCRHCVRAGVRSRLHRRPVVVSVVKSFCLNPSLAVSAVFPAFGRNERCLHVHVREHVRTTPTNLCRRPDDHDGRPSP